MKLRKSTANGPYEGRLRVAEKKDLLVDVLGPIHDIFIQHIINQTGDGAELERVLDYLMNGGVFKESKVPFEYTPNI
ncbi:hypothetical protein OROGR_029171 [Orobanche gracilis]